MTDSSALDNTLVFNLKLAVPASSATIVTQALDFGKPVKETTRKFAVVSCSGSNEQPLAYIDVTLTSTSARALRIAVTSVIEQMNLSLRTLEMFAGFQSKISRTNNNHDDDASSLNPLGSSSSSSQMLQQQQAQQQYQSGIKVSPVIGPVQPTSLTTMMMLSSTKNNNSSGSGSSSFNL
jgi:hypothetical protein